MENVVTFFVVLSGSAFGGFIFKLLERLFDEHLTNKRLIYSDRRQLAKNVVTLLAEGKRKSYTTQPDNSIEASTLIEQVTFEDERVGKTLRNLVNDWVVYAFLQEELTQQNPQTTEYRSAAKAYREGIDHDYKTLIALLKKWK